MTRNQFYPSPGFDPGWRWDLQGRARFRHKGFDVEVLVRPATDEDGAYYVDTEPSTNDVVIVGTVTLDHVEVGRAEAGADITEPYVMGQALDEVLNGAAGDARIQVARLVKVLADVDAREAKAAQSEEAAKAAQWPAKGATIRVYDVPTTDAQRERWGKRRPPSFKGEVVETPADGSTFLTIDVGGEYGGLTYTARDFPTRYTWKAAAE
ncbi:hypothetical protein [Streptomyces mirabilis]|uniref:hypothetical protein n=1 Tax=Streptomyces mirabilis TaxID=68239 RepID=UPI0036B40BF3